MKSKPFRKVLPISFSRAKSKPARDMLAISPSTNLVLNILMVILVILTLAPFYIIIITSITSEASLTENGYRLWPREFSFNAYTYLFREGSIIITAYRNTIISTLLGTILSVILITLYAYPLTRSNFRFSTFFKFFAFFTMLFNGGLVSYYMVMRQILQIHNTMWALFLPSSFSPFWVFVLRTYIKTHVPEELIEAARIDGANEWRILLQVVVPLSVPGLATVALFSAIGIWNNFFNVLLLVDNVELYNLQYTIYSTLNNIRFLLENASRMQGVVSLAELPSQTFRMAMAVVTIGPIILAYPFFQRFFVRGLTIGAIKG
ncbi:MAG: carbohydrate ABC transporter permease [Anaerolineae bacterium]|nr:carbohydrate ABC transporter permease [Anaerolineae bacterium]MDW8100340.1 carbohydrate ABC transporter permease [Anaerolineae bacterium]